MFVWCLLGRLSTKLARSATRTLWRETSSNPVIDKPPIRIRLSATICRIHTTDATFDPCAKSDSLRQRLRDDYDHGSDRPPDDLQATSEPHPRPTFFCQSATAVLIVLARTQTPPSSDTNKPQSCLTRPSTSPVPAPTARAPVAGTFDFQTRHAHGAILWHLNRWEAQWRRVIGGGTGSEAKGVRATGLFC